MTPAAAPQGTNAPAPPAARGRGWAGWAASLLLAGVFCLRVLVHYAGTPHWPLAAGLVGGFLLLCLIPPLAARRSPALVHLVLAAQSALVVRLLLVPPRADFVTSLFVALALQAGLAFGQRALVVWVAAFVALMIGPSMFVFGAVRGLALMAVPAAACVILPAYVLAHREIEAARRESQHLLDELQATQRRLQAYADQAEELAAVEARNRLARDLHDSVSQTLFSLSLNARAARLMLRGDPARLRPQLERIQAQAQEALREIRGLIEHLRPAEHAP
jgi:signal transduction histidine kinase